MGEKKIRLVRLLTRAVLCPVLVVTALAAQAPDEVAPKKPDATQVAAGKAQFSQTCGFCHGANARGASGPDLIHSSLVSHDAAGNLIGQVVRNGRPAKGMPAFDLSDEQIRAIAAYLHSEAALAYSVYSRGPGDYPLEKLLVGNAQAGKEFFNGAGQCAACHSPAGNLAHLATKYKPVDLQSRIAYPSGEVPTLTVIDTANKAWTGPEVYADEFTVSLRDTSGWVHSFERSKVKVESKNPLAAHERLLSTYTDANLHDLFAYLETLK